MKKILVVAQGGFERGGIQTVLINITRALHNEYKFDIILFTNQHGGYENEFLGYGGKIFTLPVVKDGIKGKLWGYVKFYKEYKQVKRIINCNGPYVCVHTNSGIESWAVLKAAKECGVQTRIAHSHVAYSNSASALSRRVLDKISRRKVQTYATHLLGCSNIACESMYGRESTYKILPNPYDEKKFNPTLFSNITHKDYPVLVQIGSYSDLKNQLYSLRVVELLKIKYPEIQFHMVGFDNGNYECRILEYIKNHGLEDTVWMHPSDYNIPQLLSQSNYLLLPSRTESFAIVLIEAQAMGVKCFVSDVVPNISNVGGCIYLSIDVPETVWVEAIDVDFKNTRGAHVHYDCAQFTTTTYAARLKYIYENHE